MSRATLKSVLDHVRRVTRCAGGDFTDGELLRRYARDGDNQAFGQLVERHAGLVHRACRRILGSDADADDALQAVFMVLARRAGHLSVRGSLGPWLYGVAYRVANRLRSQAFTRKNYENQSMPRISPPTDDSGDVLRVLDREVQNLPNKYRLPIVLCCLEGKTHEEAARTIGCSPGSVWWYLSRAQELLRSRLEKHGVSLTPVALLAVFESQASAASVMPTLIHSTTAAALAWSDGMPAAGGAFTARSAHLAHDMLQVSFAQRMVAVCALLVLFAGATGLGLYALSDNASPRRTPLAGTALQPIARIEVPEGMTVARLAVSHFHLALSDALGEVIVIDRITSTEIGRHKPQGMPMINPSSSLEWLPDGSLLYTDNDRCCIVDTAGRLQRTVLEPLPASVIAVSPDGRFMAGCRPLNLSFHIWNVGDGQVLHTLTLEQAIAPYLAISKDSKTLMVADVTGVLSFWNLHDGKHLRTINFGKMTAGCALGGDTIALVGADSVYVLDWETGLLRHTVPVKIDGYMPRRQSLAYSPDGRYLLALSSQTKRLHAFDVKQGVSLPARGSVDFEIDAIQFTPRGVLCVHQPKERCVSFWTMNQLFEGMAAQER